MGWATVGNGELAVDEGNGRDVRGDEEVERDGGGVGNDAKSAREPPQCPYYAAGTSLAVVNNPLSTAPNAIRLMNTLWG